MIVTNRNIVHLDLDTFFVSVERLRNSKLNGIPVIVGGQSDRGVVAACSYEARQYGVHSAMSMKMARMLCSDAVFIRGDMDLYSRYSHTVTDIIAEAAPVYEKASIDEHYLDVTGMDKFFGAYKWAHELRQRIILETGLPLSLGFSVNKTVSKIATGKAKPNGELQVPAPEVLSFLQPLPINKMPGIGEKTGQLLRSMGIVTLGMLQQMPGEMLESVLGKPGLTIWKKANGIDNTPVEPYSEQKSMSREQTFEQDTIDVDLLKRILTGIVEQLAYDLRREQWLTSCITVKVRYSNFDTHTLQKRVPYTAYDDELIAEAKSLFDRLYQRRMLIRLIGVKFSQLVRGTKPLGLFDNSQQQSRLYSAIDSMRKRYGPGVLHRAISD